MSFDCMVAVGDAVVAAVVAGLAALHGAAVLVVRPSRVAEAESIVAKASKRAAKIGCEPVRLAVLGATMRVGYRHAVTGFRTTHDDPCAMARFEERAIIAVFGAAPKVAGYRLLARVEHTEAGNIVARAPVGAADVDLAAYREGAPVCEHCGAARRRKDTFIVAGEGVLKQIGRNCLADYIRSEDAAEALRLWTLLAEYSALGRGDEDGDGWGGGGGRYSPGTLEWTIQAVACIRVEGWRKSGCQGATKDRVVFATNPPPRDADMLREWQALQPTEADVARGVMIREWCAAQEGTSDYEHNLRVAARLPTAGRNGGLLASAPVAYARHVERELAPARAARPAAPVGRHVGEVGKRIALGDLTVVRVRYSEGNYGTTTIVALVNAAGDRLTWFASGSQDLHAGDVLVGSKATIKRHGDFRGTPDTTIQRLDWSEKRAEEVRAA